MRIVVLLAALAVLVALPVRAQTPATAPAVQVVETRPRLLLTRDDLPRLRVRCGVSGLRVHPLVTSGEVRFGSHQADFERLRRFADASLGQDPLPGSL